MWRLLRGKKRQDRTTEGAYRRDDALAATARAYRATPEPAAEEATAGGGDADRPVERSPRAAEQGSTEHPQRVSNSYDVIVEQHLDERSEEHTSELQSRGHLVCRLLLEKKKENK